MAASSEEELRTLEEGLFGDKSAEPNNEQGDNEPVLSKKRLKKIAKMEKYLEFKKQRKETEKAQRAEKKKASRQEKTDMIDSLTEEEKVKYFAEKKEKLNAQRKAGEEAKEKLKEAVSSGPRVVIDLDFDDMMIENDKRHLCQQLAFSYAVNKTSPVVCNLVLTSFTGNLEQLARQVVSGIDNWICTRTPLPYDEFYKDEIHNVVYLTADSENEIQELDSSKIYVIGGIVDHNSHKFLCFNRAKEKGITTARLPISKYVQLGTSAVLTVNHVFSLLAGYYSSRDWAEVLDRVLPQRKRAAYVLEHGNRKDRRQAKWVKKDGEKDEGEEKDEG
eukprot:CAMPEP_0175050744 /NCGR_PEP_ID=MMETSP0052_2-20121109/7422_1 /TAXON_ID=51329 ORGANISM="Polytomella parva, Strain SAG 63-3" /NCGR_SAMPLE_ID=MMETSP0052_2 /ASSEMBLY_ACC=CAM_ASM_000194 /LENGTH=331 /DNA_ID=CAMNT_0016314967 /DNA_START=143 /DNA_END=1135 /DNA_ORIENTATION=-